MQIMHTHEGVLQIVYIPIKAKAGYPTMVYIPNTQKIVPSMLLQVYLQKQILKATE